MGRFIDLVGRKYGRLTVIKQCPIRINKKIRWSCLCVCGKKVIQVGRDLESGVAHSCGCAYSQKGKNNGNYRHGFKGTRFYKIWRNIQTRCQNPNRKEWRNYGGRGIKCEWEDFKDFKDDMYLSYQSHTLRFGEKDTTIDRIDNNKDYSKENCRWATMIEQERNRRNTPRFRLGDTNMTLQEWSEKLRIPYHTIYMRMWKKGKTFEEAIKN